LFSRVLKAVVWGDVRPGRIVDLVCPGQIPVNTEDSPVTPVSFQNDRSHYAGTRGSRNLLTVVNPTSTQGVAMNPSVKSLFNRITMLVVFTLAVAAVFDWSGLSS
jgi:hypothetical protein